MVRAYLAKAPPAHPVSPQAEQVEPLPRYINGKQRPQNVIPGQQDVESRRFKDFLSEHDGVQTRANKEAWGCFLGYTGDPASWPVAND